MRTHSPLVLDVREVLEQPGVRKPISFSATAPRLESGLTKLVDDLDLDLTLEAIEGGVLVQGTIEGTYEGECRRCLKALRGPLRVKGAEIYRPASEVWEEGYVIDEGKVDLEPMVRDSIGLALPLSPVCREDCQGLCPRCGADLNEGPCGCPEEADPRWSALEELKRKTELN